jgi:cytoskeletal protein CcmA (bactofilin family)
MSGDAGAAAAERRVAGWIGKAVRVEGKVVSTEDLTIDGQVEGAIELGDHSLTIGPGADIKADLTAKSIVINGSVTGNVRASERIDLHAPGSIAGNVSAPRFAMAGGATVNGTVQSGSKFSPNTRGRT